MLPIEVCSDDEPDHRAQRVVHLLPDNEWVEVIEVEEGGVVLEVDEDDHEPLPARRRPIPSQPGEERKESSLPVGGAQVQARGTSSLGKRSSEIPSLEASRDSGSRALGGTPVLRRVASSLGRRSRDNPSSQDSGPRDKRMRAESAVAPSSPPSTLRGGSISLSSDTQGGASEKSASRKHWKQEFVPERNRRVQELAKRFLQAYVLAYHPWLSTEAIEGMC